MTAFSGKGYHAFRISPIDSPHVNPNTQTVLNNPTQGWTAANNNAGQLALLQYFNPPRQCRLTRIPTCIITPSSSTAAGSARSTVRGWADQSQTVSINGNNVTVPNSTYGNFRFNGLNPNSVGMDEDYDACDLENWFLAIQSADGQVMIPSFHRPGVMRYDPTNPNTPANDWNLNYRYPNGYQGAPNYRLRLPGSSVRSRPMATTPRHSPT